MIGIEGHQLLMFIAAGWLLNLTPGPDVLYIISNALKSGTRAGIVAGLGITAGCFVHIFAAAVGVGALLATSATAFAVLKWVGAAYLMWMGVRMVFANAAKPADVGGGEGAGLRDSAASAATPGGGAAQPLPLAKVFLGGFWTNVLNPKVALFFLAFVPQFIDAATPNKALAFIVLGCIFNINGMLWCNALAWFTARASARIKLDPKVVTWLNRATGCLFVWLGLKLALSKNT